MAQYIPKSALVEEINTLLDDEFRCNSYDEATGFQNALTLIKKFIDTLEVKEIDVEKEKPKNGKENNMLTEDYVSFEIAKLLKEKGFYNPYCYYYYFTDIESKTPCVTDKVIDINEDKYLAPTLQMAMKWLREVHNYLILIDVDDLLEGYQWAIYYTDSHKITPHAEWIDKASYEEACEAAIKYCLEHLI